MLISAESNNLNSPSHFRDIFEAAMLGPVEIVEHYIVMKNIDVNIKDSDGWTPLHWAVG